MTPLEIAELFHETYERLAPDFGYLTRDETKVFDPESKNGKLMIAVCGQVARIMCSSVGIEDKNGKAIHEGHILRTMVKRVGGCSGNWYRKTNKNHGPCHLDLTVVWNDKYLKYDLVPDKVQLAELKAPKGKEVYDQEVSYPTDFCYMDFYGRDYEIVGQKEME